MPTPLRLWCQRSRADTYLCRSCDESPTALEVWVQERRQHSHTQRNDVRTSPTGLRYVAGDSIREAIARLGMEPVTMLTGKGQGNLV